jgi:hypothetical protein
VVFLFTDAIIFRSFGQAFAAIPFTCRSVCWLANVFRPEVFAPERVALLPRAVGAGARIAQRHGVRLIASERA